MKILLMEDEPAIRLAMKRGMKRAGHQVEVAANLSEARALAKTIQPDALVSDLKLPDGSGLDLAEELAIPFILMSGYAVFDDAVAALRLGCVDFFTKPVSIEDLLTRLESIASKPSDYHPGCLDLSDGVKMVMPHPEGFSVQDLHASDMQWSSQEEALEVFNSIELTVSVWRHILAELMQSSDVGRLVMNTSPGRWSAWLDQSVTWDGQQQQDRLQCIRDLADICICRGDGIFVESFHAA